MDVIGVGFGRTGTLSLRTALEQLGFGPCMHMVSVIDNPALAERFLQAADGDADALAGAMAGCRSTVDWPGVYFWRELVVAHPAAKVVLTVRDPQKWYDSVHKTIYQAAVRAQEAGMVSPPMTMSRRIVWDGTFGGRLGDRDHAIRVYEEHNEAVRREVPAERLLEFEVAEGWEPLCAFLDVPVPAEPFPRTNDQADFQARIDRLRAAAK